MKNIKPFLTVLVFLPHAVCAQNTEQEGEEVGKKINLCSNIEWKIGRASCRERV